MLNDKHFKALMDLVMASDPWPVEGKENMPIIVDIVEINASERGYDSWETAFHEFKSKKIGG